MNTQDRLDRMEKVTERRMPTEITVQEDEQNFQTYCMCLKFGIAEEKIKQFLR